MKRRGALFSVPVLLALGTVLYLSLRGLDRAQPFDESADGRAPRYELLGAEWTRTGADGAPEFVARATQLAWYEDQSAELEQAEVSGLGGAGSPWLLRAPHGRMPADSRDLLLYGQVEGTGRAPDGHPLQLETERMWIDTEDRELRTDSDVTLYGPGRDLSATGLAADFSGHRLQLLSNVRARYEPLPPAAIPAAEPAPGAPAEPPPQDAPVNPDQNPAKQDDASTS
jgi:LPS export ABC transporter protein LptC